MRFFCAFLLVCVSLPAVAQVAAVTPNAASRSKVPLRHRHERLLVVVPMVGQGTAEDPRRPAFVPAPARPGDTVAERTDLAGILGFTAIVSDDGQFALVEFVAEDPEAFRAIRTDARAVKAFEVGKTRREDIETELRKHRKDFDLDRMGVSLP